MASSQSSVAGEALLPTEEESMELQRVSRASSRNSRHSNRSRRSSRAGSVSMDRNAQTQQEVDSAARQIKEKPYGKAILILAKELNKTPGSNINLLELAAALEGIQEGEIQNPPQVTSHGAAHRDHRHSHNHHHHADHAPMSRSQFVYNAPLMSNSQDRTEIRRTLLDIELNDRTIQRRLVEPPEHFRTGISSISDSDKVRLEKVKMYFHFSFTGKKFSGRKKGNEELDILQLLLEFNNAQEAVNLTEFEFVSFLTKAMTGDAHSTMLNYLELHKRGKMTVGDIYLSLTDIYFQDLRPASAAQKLQDMNENNHEYSSLSEAHNEIQHLANLASLAARSKGRQEVLAADHYQHTLLRIIPRDYKAVAAQMIETCGNYKATDLEPHEILSCLNKMRHPIDDAMRKAQVNRSKNKDKAKIKQTKAIEKRTEPSAHTDNGTIQKVSDSKKKGGKEKERTPAQIAQSKADKAKAKNKKEKDSQGNSSVLAITQEACKLCGNPQHSHSNCPLFPPGRNSLAKYECRKCSAGLFHFTKYCPANLDTKN